MRFTSDSFFFLSSRAGCGVGEGGGAIWRKKEFRRKKGILREYKQGKFGAVNKHLKKVAIGIWRIERNLEKEFGRK